MDLFPLHPIVTGLQGTGRLHPQTRARELPGGKAVLVIVLPSPGGSLTLAFQSFRPARRLVVHGRYSLPAKALRTT